PEAGMDAPNSAKTRPSAIASKAPTPQAMSDCGPPRVAMMAGTVIKGPVPTILDMLMEIAFTRPNLRGRATCSGLESGESVIKLALNCEYRSGRDGQNTLICPFGPANRLAQQTA